jgi:7,8-dihydro-6-hydroxymethylpterin-pyrophosphokinase
MRQSHLVYLSLGTNLGNRLENLRRAISLLKKSCFTKIKCSIVLETEALLLDNSPPEWNRPF